MENKGMLTIFLILILNSCMTIGQLVIPFPEKEIAIQEGVFVKINKIIGNQATIRSGKYIFSPNDDNHIISTMDISIMNNSITDFDKRQLKTLELLLVNSGGVTKYINWTKPFQYQAYNKILEDKTLKAGEEISNRIYFVYDKSFKPAALVSNRTDSIIFLYENNLLYENVKLQLSLASMIETVFSMAETLPFEVVEEYMISNGIDINSKNNKELNLLYIGLIFGNNSVIEGTIKSGIDIHSISYMGTVEIAPIHVALMNNNKQAIELLVNAGANIRVKSEQGDEPAVFFVRENNIEALKILVEYGVDIKSLEIPMIWSPPIPILKYAKDRNLTEMSEFLENLE